MFSYFKFLFNLPAKCYQLNTKCRILLYMCNWRLNSLVKIVPSSHCLLNTIYKCNDNAKLRYTHGLYASGFKTNAFLGPSKSHILVQLGLLHTGQSLLEKNDSPEQNENNEDKFRTNFIKISAVLSIVSLMSSFYIFKKLKEITEVGMSWENFTSVVLPSGEVEAAFISPRTPYEARFKLHQGAVFGNSSVRYINISLSRTQKVEDRLREEERKLNINPQHYIPVFKSTFDDSLLQDPLALLALLSIIGATVYLIVVTRTPLKMPKKPPVKSESSQKKPPSIEFDSFNIFKMFDTDIGFVKDTKIKFEDVAGMQEAKQEVMELVHFLKDSSRYKMLGAKMPHGCLLTGPPGVGKTMLAKAVASEAGVPFIAKAGSDFVEMIGGLGARRIRQLFEKAREVAPCIIYIDELDALGAARSGDSRYSSASSEKDQTLNQILVEMDGMLSRQHQVIVLASTNRADILDKALLRPGRFDRLIHIDLPNRAERKDILDRHLASVKLEKKPSDYSEQLSSETPGMSGADLANICNEAAIYAARKGNDFITKKHLNYALERVTSGAPKSTTSLSPEERQTVCVHEAGHALVGWLLEHTNALAKISIIPRSKGSLGVTRTVPSERHLHTEEQLFDNMCMALGGRAAEDVMFGRITHGAEDDLKRVTNMAYAQVKKFGFNPVVGPLSFQDEGSLQVRPYSEALATIIDLEVRKLVTRAYEKTRSLLEQHRQNLQTVSDALVSSETLTYDDVVKLIGPPIYGDKKLISSIPFFNESEAKDSKNDNSGS